MSIPPKKMKIIVMGMGNRGLGCFAKGILDVGGKGRPEFPEHGEIVALVDSNLTRGKAGAVELGLPDLPVFRKIEEAAHLKADWCIVTTPDHEHLDSVCGALKTGLNVMVDKPLATSVMECDQIMQCMKEEGREVVVGHNMRYQQHTYEAAKLIRAGEIGKIITVEAAEVLDYSHGGDYFHRWHSDFEKSSGLMNHKCCHHLDLMNWILDDEPIGVSAIGGRSFYGERKDLNHADRCLDCEVKKDCPHVFDIDKWDGVYRRIYKEAEGEDGYIRDKCVFSDRHTINDHENLVIKYASGVRATFTLVTFAPREFTYFYFTGTKGRIEVGFSSTTGEPYLRITRPNGETESRSYKVDNSGEHGHGGADVSLIAHILGIEEPDPMKRAFPIEAKRAVSIADMAARSIADGGRYVSLSETGHDKPPAPPQE